MIRPLDPSVRAHLRSGVAVPSVAQCVEELVLNSLDAAASCVAVRIDLENFWIQVVDNGHGIPKDQLTIVGDRYATSKCHTVTDLENLNFFGYRGEALASLAQVCAVLEIESRHKGSIKANTKVFRHGKVVCVFESKGHRPTVGTTVTVHNVFHNLPVRQKFVSVALEQERIRERVAAIALIHPGVSFTLRNEGSAGKYLQTHKTSSLVSSFGSIFGTRKSMSLREASHQHKQFNITGFISREGHRNKDLQFLYINNRLILRTKVHKFLNMLLSKSTVVNRRAGQWEPRTPTVKDNSAADASSPGKLRDYYGMFVLNISCPLSEYDISLDPAKTLVEFKDWEAVLTCVQDMVHKFLKQENLTMSLDLNVGEHMGSLLQDDEITTSKASPSKEQTEGVILQEALNSCGVDYGEGISTLNSNNILHSQTVRRRPHAQHGNVCHIEVPEEIDNTGSEMTAGSSAEKSQKLCSSLGTEEMPDKDRKLMPTEQEQQHGNSNLDSHTRSGSTDKEENDKEIRYEETNTCTGSMNDTFDDTFDYGPVISQDSNIQLLTTNNLGDSFLQDSDIQPVVLNNGMESASPDLDPLPDPHNCWNQTVTVSDDSKSRQTDDMQEAGDVHCDSNQVLHPLPQQPFTCIRATRSPVYLKKVRTSNRCVLDDSGVELCDEGGPTERSCLSKCTKTSQITLSGKKRLPLSLSSKLSKMANLSTDNYTHHHSSSSTDVVKDDPPENLTQVPDRSQKRNQVGMEDRSKDKKIHKVGSKNEEDPQDGGLVVLDRAKSQSSLGLFKLSQAELLAANQCAEDTVSGESNLTKGMLNDARRSPELKKKDNSCLTAEKIVTSTPRSVCPDAVSSCKSTPVISLKRSYSQLSLQKLSKRVRVYSGQATLQKHLTGGQLESEQKRSHGKERNETKSDGKTEQKQSVEASQVKTVIMADMNDNLKDVDRKDTKSIVNQVETVRNFVVGHRSGDKPAMPIRVDKRVKVKRTFVTSEKLLQTPSEFLLHKTQQPKSLAVAQHDLKGKHTSLLMPERRIQKSVSNPNSCAESVHAVTTLQRGFIEKCESHGWRQETQANPSDRTSSKYYQSSATVELREKHGQVPTSCKTDTKDVALEKESDMSAKAAFEIETSNLMHVSSEQGEDESSPVSSHDKSSEPQQSRSSSCDVTDTFVFSPKGTFKDVSVDGAFPNNKFQEDPTSTELLCANGNFHRIDTSRQAIYSTGFHEEKREICCSSRNNEETNFKEVDMVSCDVVKVDSTDWCDGGKVWYQTLKERQNVTDDTDDRCEDLEQGCEQIVPGSKECSGSTHQPAEHGFAEGAIEFVCDSSTEDRQCAPPSSIHAPNIKSTNIAETSAALSQPHGSALGIKRATSSFGRLTKTDDSRGKSCDMSENIAAVEKDCTADNKQSSPEVSSEDGAIEKDTCIKSQGVAPQDELCKAKLSESDLESTNTTEMHNLDQHASASYNIGFRKVNAVWAQHFDQARGVDVFVNLMTGHTQLDCPQDDCVDIGASSSVNVSMSAGGEKKWRGTVHPFLTHNATPFLPRAKRPCQDTDMPPDLSTQHAVGQMLVAHLEEQEEEEGSGVKWRDKLPSAPDELDSVAQLWDSWENPVFSRTEQSILNVAAGTGGTARVRAVVQPYRFNRDMLDTIQIIGQVDNKFIACMMKNSAQNFKTTSVPNLLVLIDQHAAHERVRLESLHDGLYELDPGSAHQRLKSSHVIPPVDVPLPAEEFRLLQAYRGAFEKLGVSFSTDRNKVNTAMVSSLPCCVVEREYNERKRGRQAVAVELVESLIKEHLELLKTTDGAGATLPPTLHRILNSQACHGAIKFGDPLQEADCADLIRCLSKCNLPFQCAHGRPSLIPIIDLASPLPREKQDTDCSRPSLWKLKKRRALGNSRSERHKTLEQN